MTNKSDLGLVETVSDAVVRARKELERRIETDVLASLSRVRAPFDAELAAMRGKMDQLGQKVDALVGKRR